jgi:hypothetical protein
LPKGLKNFPEFYKMAQNKPGLAQDTLIITNRHKEPTTALRDMAPGGTAWLCGGGPSLTPAMAALLSVRGVFSLAVNNVAGMAGYRPSAFVCSDPPCKFHHGLWLDPTVMKFIPMPKLNHGGGRNRLREKVGDKFIPLVRNGKEVTTNLSPNVWGFERRSWLTPDNSFFTENSAAWGNNKTGAVRTGQPRTVCTMLLAIRLLYHLGFRRIFLAGVDFRMQAGLAPNGNYSFGELRDDAAVKSNNEQYRIVNTWLCAMVGNNTFEKYGLSLYNVNPVSGLRAFPHVPFGKALETTLEGFPVEPFSLSEWYKK